MHDVKNHQTAFQLPKTGRLTDTAQFLAVFGQHKKYSNRYFRILVHHRDGQPDPRIGIIVSRRVSRKAVNRNRIKRQVREAFRQNRRKLNNMDIVVIAHKVCESAPKGALYGHIVNLLKKLER